jgi:hypothetical protein
MAIRAALITGIKLVSQQVDDVKVPVSFQAWIGDDGKGGDAYAAAVTVRPVVSRKVRTIRTEGGQFAQTLATLTFVDKVAPTTAQAGKTRRQPFDPRDLFVLPDGATAPVIDIGGPADPKAVIPGDTFIHVVTLGNVPRGQ